MRPIATVAAAAIAVLAAAEPALTHPGHGEASGFSSGLAHPLFGADHLLAMVAVGLWAGLVGGRALWLWPAVFVTVMVAGALADMAGFALPLVEPGILASVIVLGALIVLALRAPLWPGAALIALFALAHGHAHGTEAPVAYGGLEYVLGFALATAALHGAGLAAAVLARPGAALAVRAAGAVILVAGVGLAFS